MMTEPAQKPVVSKKKARKDLVRVLVVAFLFIGIALLLNHPYIRSQLFDIEKLRRELQGGGYDVLLIFVGAAALINAFGIPRLWICAVAGTIYGAVEGGIVALAATLLGSSLNFLMGRSLLRGPIKRHMPVRMRRWYNAFNDHGFRAILYLRLFPLTNATLTNLLGGASKMRYRDYLLATTIGYLPFTIAFATLGSSAAKKSGSQLTLGILLFACVGIGQWIWSRSRKGRNPADDDSLTTSARSIETPPMKGN